MATKPRGEGAKGLIGRATKKRTFFAASLIHQELYIKIKETDHEVHADSV